MALLYLSLERWQKCSTSFRVKARVSDDARAATEGSRRKRRELPLRRIAAEDVVARPFRRWTPDVRYRGLRENPPPLLLAALRQANHPRSRKTLYTTVIYTYISMYAYTHIYMYICVLCIYVRGASLSRIAALPSRATRCTARLGWLIGAETSRLIESFLRFNIDIVFPPASHYARCSLVTHLHLFPHCT